MRRSASASSARLTVLFAFLVALLVGMATTQAATPSCPSGDDAADRCVLQPFAPLSQPAIAEWHDDGPFDELHASASGSALSPRTGFTVILASRNPGEIERRATAVSDPNSPDYGKFMTPQEIAAMSDLPKEQQQQVVDWLTQSLHVGEGANSDAAVENRGASIRVSNVRVVDVQQAFACRMNQFTEQLPPHPPTNIGGASTTAQAPPRVVYRCMTDLSIPRAIAPYVTGTIGLMDLPTRISHGRGPHPHPGRIGPIIGHHGVGASEGAHDESGVAAGSHTAAEPLHLATDPSTTSTLPAAYAHRTLRTSAQLQHAAMQFERDMRGQ